MIKDIRPIDYELMHIYITADGKRHFSLKKAEAHQRRLIAKNNK